MIFDIKDIYAYNKINNTPMLSEFTSAAGAADFWKPYKDNFAWFDRMFMKKYRSWYPMDQDGELDDISEEFADDVKSWLMINDKRYSELYRMQTIPDDDKFSLTDNVTEHEVIETEYGKSVTFNKGSQTDTEDNSRTYGQQEINTDATNTTGATGKTITDSTSPFNDSEFTNVDKTVEADNAREDIIDQTVTNGAHTDTEDLSTTRGAREDTTEDSGTDTTTRDRSGNIGVRTVDEMLTIHKDTWVDFSFYEIIFAEITRELLRGGVY